MARGAAFVHLGWFPITLRELRHALRTLARFGTGGSGWPRSSPSCGSASASPIRRAAFAGHSGVEARQPSEASSRVSSRCSRSCARPWLGCCSMRRCRPVRSSTLPSSIGPRIRDPIWWRAAGTGFWNHQRNASCSRADTATSDVAGTWISLRGGKLGLMWHGAALGSDSADRGGVEVPEFTMRLGAGSDGLDWPHDRRAPRERA